MATTEEERWTERVCPECGAYIRHWGSLSEDMGMCSVKCEGDSTPARRIHHFPTIEEYYEKLMLDELIGDENE